MITDIATLLETYAHTNLWDRALDEIVPTPEGLRFASRLLVYDSEMVPNSLIYPV